MVGCLCLPAFVCLHAAFCLPHCLCFMLHHHTYTYRTEKLMPSCKTWLNPERISCSPLTEWVLYYKWLAGMSPVLAGLYSLMFMYQPLHRGKTVLMRYDRNNDNRSVRKSNCFLCSLCFGFEGYIRSARSGTGRTFILHLLASPLVSIKTFLYAA